MGSRNEVTEEKEGMVEGGRGQGTESGAGRPKRRRSGSEGKWRKGKGGFILSGLPSFTIVGTVKQFV